MLARMVLIQPDPERRAEQRGTATDQPISPIMPRPNHTPCSGLARALSLRAAFAPICSAESRLAFGCWASLMLKLAMRRRNPVSSFAMTERTLFSRSSRVRNSCSTASRKLAEVRSAEARRTETSTSRPVLTSTPSSTATKTSPSDRRLVSQNPRRERGDAIQPVREDPNEPVRVSATMRETPARLGEDLKRQEHLKIHARRLHAPPSRWIVAFRFARLLRSCRARSPARP